MFAKMEALPISYFDNNEFGDIMSHYTNDMDVVRQLISNSLQGLYMGIFGTVGTLILMFYYSVWMSLVVLLGVVVMNLAIAYLGGKSAHFFKENQKAMGACEGFVEEAMTGQRTIKVFCHEDEICKTFDDKNEDLFQAYKYAMRYANIMTQ